MFCRYVLRTTDVDGAVEFYRRSVGLALSPRTSSLDANLEAWPLHERARARGAPPHWLGHLAVNDVDSMVERFTALGSEPLGPTLSTDQGARFAALRDPFGNVVALRAGGNASEDRPVAWHQLHTRDLAGAWALYRELFGWVSRETIEGPDPGGHKLFAWRDGGEAVGMMANSARRSGIHTHWLFYFPVTDVDASVARIRSLGGRAFDPILLPGDLRLSACEDPQGAAFGVVERR